MSFGVPKARRSNFKAVIPTKDIATPKVKPRQGAYGIEVAYWSCHVRGLSIQVVQEGCSCQKCRERYHSQASCRSAEDVTGDEEGSTSHVSGPHRVPEALQSLSRSEVKVEDSGILCKAGSPTAKEGAYAQLRKPHTYLLPSLCLAVAFGILILLLFVGVLSTIVSSYCVSLPPV